MRKTKNKTAPVLAPEVALNGEERPDRFLNAVGVRKRYAGKSEAWLERMLKNKNHPQFPSFIRVGRARLWNIADLEAYEKHLASIESKRRKQLAESAVK
jgi:hypothetical protein